MSFTEKIKSEILEVGKKLKGNRAFLRDSFLAGGVISNPSRTYHLEFTTDNLKANKLMDILKGLDFNPKQTTRKSQFVIYLKEGDEIAGVLSQVGAHKALLEFEEIRVEKSVREEVNRLVNCETANLSKSINAGIIQSEAIDLICKTIGLSSLSPALREAAEVRLINPLATMSEIGEFFSPPLSKSGVNHRFRKLLKIAENIKGKTEEA